MTSAVGCSGTIVLAGNTCTITNTAQPAQPTILTDQRVILHDAATIFGVRRVAGDSLSVTFVLFPSLAACTAGTGALGIPEVRAVHVCQRQCDYGDCNDHDGRYRRIQRRTLLLEGDFRRQRRERRRSSASCGREQTAVTFTYQPVGDGERSKR